MIRPACALCHITGFCRLYRITGVERCREIEREKREREVYDNHCGARYRDLFGINPYIDYTPPLHSVSLRVPAPFGPVILHCVGPSSP
jgi:hypothetical protein